MMYAFLKVMWKLGKVSEEQVQKYSPRFITEEERDDILNTSRE